ncbi:proline extensin-like receptor kinase 1 [Artemisia annua]|uniref:non-specific serine/threonine protein kinase n=1 Tax=Artemisia annua TaxID=35608 RepID=A0A2U1NZ27_ARTAN|nr:proline extensin-like receptor kinase 1 [Artemisia annua]
MATAGFSESNFLGEGGFADMYKGVLPNGKEVAVKKLKTGSGQGEPRDRPVMEFPARLRIALGAAKGIAYLHDDCDPKIIHRDIKSANILIACNFEAKVADYYLYTAQVSSVTLDLQLTMFTLYHRYLAPEFVATGKLTFQCDVFSYGVVLLELITGRRQVDAARTSMDDTLVKWASPLLTRSMDDDCFDFGADPRLQKQYNHSEMARMVSCAVMR